jgi:hypothetical protein
MMWIATTAPRLEIAPSRPVLIPLAPKFTWSTAFPVIEPRLEQIPTLRRSSGRLAGLEVPGMAHQAIFG